MRILGVVLYWIGMVLLWITGLIIAASILFGWYQNGFGWVRETLNPFNLWNYLVTLIALAPGILLTMAGEKLQNKAAIRQQ